MAYTSDMTIREFCKEHRYSQKAISNAIGIGEHTISRAAARNDRIRFDVMTGKFQIYKLRWEGEL